MSEFDNIAQAIAQLKEVVANAGKDTAVLDYDKLGKAIADNTAKVKSNEPVRKGEAVGHAGVEANGSAKIVGGKYDGMTYNELEFVDWFLGKAAAVSPGKVGKASKGLKELLTQKALSSTGSGTGDEFVPTSLAGELWNDMFLDSRVASQFSRITMATDPYEVPIGWGDPTWRKGTQSTATTASDPATAKATFTSTEQVLEIDWSYDLDEDAVIAALPTLRDMVGRSGGEQIDKFMLNADSTNTATGNINLDDADPADDSYYLSAGQDGLRHLWIVDNTGQGSSAGAALDHDKWVAGLVKLGKYAADPSRLVAFCDPVTAIRITNLTNVLTVDKFGPSATILNGQLASYAGVPIVVTPAQSLTEADGKVSTTAASNTKGQVTIAHRDMWRVGFKRDMLMEMYRDVQKRQLILVASFRIAVGARGTRSAATHTAGIYNITV